MHMHKHQCMHTSTHQQGLVHVNMFRHMYMHASSCTAQMYKVTHEHTCTEILPEPNGTWKSHGYGGGRHCFILATKFNLPLPRLSPAPQANLRPPLRHSWGRGAPSEPIGPAQGSLSLKLVAHGCPSILLQPCIRVSWRNPPRGTNFFPRTICLRLLHLRLLSLARRASTVLAAVTEAPLSLPNPHFLGPLALPLESYEILRRKDSFSSEDRGCFCSALCFL